LYVTRRTTATKTRRRRGRRRKAKRRKATGAFPTGEGASTPSLGGKVDLCQEPRASTYSLLIV